MRRLRGRLACGGLIWWCVWLLGREFCRRKAGACMPGDEFGGRESIFWIPHTNEFSGRCGRAREPRTQCCGVIRCRRDYKREKKKVGVGSDLVASSGPSAACSTSPLETSPVAADHSAQDLSCPLESTWFCAVGGCYGARWLA